MKDLISFSLRGAWGGAIGAVIAWFLFYVLSFGPFWGLLFVLHPIVLVYLAVPGALVGLILWILTGRTAESLNAISRGAIGTGVILGLIALLSIYQLAWQVNQLGLIELNLLRIFQVTIIEAVFLGGAAGLACPSRRQEVLKEGSNITYWERVALYEMAEREAQIARQKRTHTSIG